MPICPNCGSFVSQGSPTCSCGTSLGGRSREEERHEDPEEVERRERAEECYREACDLERQERYREAFWMYRKAKDLGYRGFGSYDEGMLYYNMGDYERALECFNKSGDGDRHYNVAIMVGKTLSRLERYDEALDMYFKAIGLINKSNKFIQNYTNPNFGIYYTQEELDREAMEKRARKRKELARVYSQIALAYMKQENFTVSIKYIDEALDFDGKNADYWNVKAIILERMKRFKKSKEHYEKALELEYGDIFIENKARMIRDWCRYLYEKEVGLVEASRLIDEAIDDLSAIETDEDIFEYMILRNDIKDKLEFESDAEELKSIGRKNLITITGMSDFGYPNFEKGMTLRLVRESDDKFDCRAIAVYSGDEQVGYVANTSDTACELTLMASEMEIGDAGRAGYLMYFMFHYRIAVIRR